MDTVRELEAKYAIERKNLMKSLFDYLRKTGIPAALQQEPDLNSLGVSVMESVIGLKGMKLDKIRLFSYDSGSCGVSGNILRFLFEVNLGKELSKEQVKDLNASTRLIKEGKVMKIFGGKVVGVKWTGQKLADVLNEDSSISDDFMKCIKSWNNLEFQIEADPSGEVYILGPWFSEPGNLAGLYKAGMKEDVQCCLFGISTVEKIAGHIQNSVL